jgi:phosphoribosylaminoimidazole (AIR) synthetase
MLRTFNMGVGLIVVCASRDADRILGGLREGGERGAFRLGVIVPGDRRVSYS